LPSCTTCSHTVNYPDWSDLSNTHLAISALRLAKDCGATVDDEVFLNARAFARACQNADGGFGLTAPDTKPLRLRGASHGDATAAGLGVIFDGLPAGGVDAETTQSIADALGWLEQEGPWPQPGWQWAEDQRDDVMYLWRLTRLMDSAHLRSLGDNALRPLIAEALLERQAVTGTWADDENLPTTALAVNALLTLRQPILINRLSETGDSGQETTALIHSLNAANDINLTWQKTTWGTRYSTLTEAPIWWLVTDEPIALSESTARLVQRFVEEGGTLIVQITSDDPEVIETSAAFLEAILPAWPARPLTEFTGIRDMAPDGELDLSCLEGGVAIGDSARLAAAILPPNIYTDLDVDSDRYHATTAVMLNLIRLATGEPCPAGYEPFAAPTDKEPPAPAFGVAVARVAIGEEWTNSPRAFDVMSSVLAEAISLGVSEMDATDLTMPVNEAIKVLWLTGANWPVLSSNQQANLKAFLDDGGLLVVTPVTGQSDSADDARTWLGAAFEPSLKALTSYHPLNTGQFGSQVGNVLSDIAYNDSVTGPPTGSALEAITLGDRQSVVFCPFGLLAAAEGTPAWNNPAPVTDDARRVVANILLYALAGE
jgi:hypothetical protein